MNCKIFKTFAILANLLVIPFLVSGQQLHFYYYTQEPNTFCAPYKLIYTSSYNKKFHKKIASVVKSQAFSSYDLKEKLKDPGLVDKVKNINDNKTILFYEIALVVADSTPQCFEIKITELKNDNKEPLNTGTFYTKIKTGIKLLKKAEVFRDFQADYYKKFYKGKRLPFLQVYAPKNPGIYCQLLQKQWQDYSATMKFVQFVFPLSYIPSYFPDSNFSPGQNDSLYKEIVKIHTEIREGKLLLYNTVTRKKFSKKEQTELLLEYDEENYPIAFAVDGILKRTGKGLKFKPQYIELFYEEISGIDEIETLGYFPAKKIKKYSKNFWEAINNISLNSPYYFFPTFVNDAFAYNISQALKYKYILLSGNWENLPTQNIQKR